MAGVAAAVLVVALYLVAAGDRPAVLPSPTVDALPDPPAAAQPDAAASPAVAGDSWAAKPPAARDAGGTVTVEVRLARDFVPTNRGGGPSATWNPRGTALTAARPQGITGEPEYSGAEQAYGEVRLGTSPRPPFAFVFDVPARGNPTLHFDFNRNGDLRDDGPPLENRGTTRFASMLRFDVHDLIPELAGTGDEKTFQVWFFTNASLWKKRRVGFYSRTSMRGHVVLDGEEYLAWIADSGLNDADFTNDGISVDADRDGKVTREERVRPGEVATIGGNRYRFDVRW